MNYYVLRYSMPVALRLFFKKIFINNKQNIPKKGPVILASMHPNSFIDDFTLGVFSGRRLRFLARGDVFKTKVARFFLNQMRVSPVYRAMDNAKDVKKNLEAFNVYTQTLEKGGTLLIHSEGICVNEKKVRPLKKGTAKIAFGAEEAHNFKLGIQIVPISLNYTNAPKTRENLMIECAEPILVNDYKDLYLENPAKAINTINKDIFAALVKGAVVQKKGTKLVSEYCLELARNNHPVSALPIAVKNNVRSELEKKVCNTVNTIHVESPDKFAQLKSFTCNYFTQMEKYKIEDREVARSKTGLIMHWLVLFLLSPIFVIGYAFNIVPIIISRKLAQKVCKTIEFYASVFLGAAWLLFIIQYFILFLVFSLIFGKIGFFAIVGVALAGFWSVLIRDQFLIGISKFRFIRFKAKHPKLVDELKEKRKEILQLIHIK